MFNEYACKLKRRKADHFLRRVVTENDEVKRVFLRFGLTHRTVGATTYCVRGTARGCEVLRADDAIRVLFAGEGTPFLEGIGLLAGSAFAPGRCRRR